MSDTAVNLEQEQGNGGAEDSDDSVFEPPQQVNPVNLQLVPPVPDQDQLEALLNQPDIDLDLDGEMSAEDRILLPDPFRGRTGDDAEEFWRRLETYLTFKGSQECLIFYTIRGY